VGMIVASRALGVLWNLGFPFVAINGVPFPATREHDTFEWFAEIFIPGAVGLATVAVTWAAVYATVSANRLAKDVENQRLAAENERSKEASIQRLQEMALSDARVLQRWVERLRGQVLHVDGRPPVSRTPLEQAEIDARVAFDQSLVPGAAELYELTRFDLDRRRKWLSISDGDSVMAKARRSRNIEQRMNRTKDRIRSWALDPEAQAARIQSELHLANDDEVAYLTLGEGLVNER